MKLRVNLYQADLQPRFDKMTLSQLGRAFIWVSALLLLAGGWAYQQVAAAKAQQQSVQQQQQQKTQELETYQQALANRQPSAQLQQQAALLQQSISQKQQLLSYLQHETSKAPPRYAAVMQHLDAIDPKGLWLTGFSLGTIQRFDGIAAEAGLLPEWLKALGAAPGLQGLHFSSVKVEPFGEGRGEEGDQDQIDQYRWRRRALRRGVDALGHDDVAEEADQVQQGRGAERIADDAVDEDDASHGEAPVSVLARDGPCVARRTMRPIAWRRASRCRPSANDDIGSTSGTGGRRWPCATAAKSRSSAARFSCGCRCAQAPQ